MVGSHMRTNKLRLGYTNEYLDEDIDKIKPKELVKERNIKCSFCGSKLKSSDWLVIVHTPGDKAKPKRLHFFCKSRNCRYDWGLKSQRQREM